MVGKLLKVKPQKAVIVTYERWTFIYKRFQLQGFDWMGRWLLIGACGLLELLTYGST